MTETPDQIAARCVPDTNDWNCCWSTHEHFEKGIQAIRQAVAAEIERAISRTEAEVLEQVGSYLLTDPDGLSLMDYPVQVMEHVGENLLKQAHEIRVAPRRAAEQEKP
jgi:hypothetical protein